MILDNPSHLLVICEGEKKADAVNAAGIASGVIGIAWVGGAGSWEKTDWDILANRSVILWPDSDAPGQKCMDALGARLSLTQYCAVRIVQVPPGKPKGWDAADAEPAERLHLIKGALPFKPPKIVEEIEPDRQTEASLATSLDAALNGLWSFATEFQGGSWLRRSADGLWQPDGGAMALFTVIRERKEDCKKLQRGTSIRGIELHMRSGPLTDFEGGWDADPHLAGLPDGKVLDLRTGSTRPGTEVDRITKKLGVAPQPGIPERFLKFLNESVPTEGLQENVDFLQRWLGYVLTGHNREHTFLMLLGSGGNGKSTLLNIIQTILGDYFVGLPSESLFGDIPTHRQWLARIAGARCVSISEPDPGSKWRAGELKDLTGGGGVTANHMRQNSFDFHPVAKVVILANDAPRLNRVDEAFRRRLRLMPFTRKPELPDSHLGDKLKGEAGRILSWFIVGAIEYLKDGFGDTPAAAQLASREYLANEDTMGQWLSDRLEPSFGAEISNAELMESSRSWTEIQGIKQWAAKTISARLLKDGFRPFRTSMARGFTGLRISKH